MAKQVLIEQCLSRQEEVKSGVPQGSVLGPILFILFINDITQTLNNPVCCKLFADDVKLYSIVDTDMTNNPLQEGLNRIFLWSQLWQLPINQVKCNVLQIANQQDERQKYTLNGHVIKYLHSTRDLGIEVDSSLKFSSHVDNVVTKNQRLGILFRGFSTRHSDFLLRAYKTYIRPILEYCSSIWSPYLIKDIDKLERVQRFFTRRLPSLKLYSYSERLKILKLEPLELRRLKADLTMYYKILNGLVDLDAAKFFVLDRNVHNTRTNGVKLVKPVSRSSHHSNVFSHRCINCWNALPPDIVSASSLPSFKYRLDKFDFSRFLTLQSDMGV